jgi:thymidylate synthase (FAD)
MSNNKVELIGHYGSDELIACSAWTSTSRDLSESKKLRVPDLLDMLWGDCHETPYEKGIVHFLVDTDIATHIHLLKHRISSMNAESARYKELKEDKYYIPEDWNTNSESRPEATWADRLAAYTEEGNRLYHQALAELSPVLGRKRAKESARFFKTYSSQIQADILFNMRSFANFQRLRNSEHAQKEVRDVAQQMLTLVENIEGNPFKQTLEAFKAYKTYRTKE